MNKNLQNENERESVNLCINDKGLCKVDCCLFKMSSHFRRFFFVFCSFGFLLSFFLSLLRYIKFFFCTYFRLCEIQFLIYFIKTKTLNVYTLL